MVRVQIVQYPTPSVQEERYRKRPLGGTIDAQWERTVRGRHQDVPHRMKRYRIALGHQGRAHALTRLGHLHGVRLRRARGMHHFKQSLRLWIELRSHDVASMPEDLTRWWLRSP